MHNMDRILNEEMADEYGFLNEGEFEQENEFAYEGDYEGEAEWEGEWEGGQPVFSQEMEYELAAELLAINNEQELDQFLGRLVKRAARGVSTFARSNVGRSLIGGLKSVAKTALPIVGKVAGTALGGPVGGMIGGKLGSLATNLFEANLEGLSNEDREFEVARRVVRLTGAATRNAVRSVRNGQARRVPPVRIAANALKNAAAKHAPGLLTPVSGNRPRPVVAGGNPYGGFHGMFASMGGMSGGGSMPPPPPPQASSGTWVRQGDQIILTL